MAKPAKGKGGLSTAPVRREAVPKKTSIGRSKNTVFKSKNDKRNKKSYRGQGR